MKEDIYIQLLFFSLFIGDGFQMGIVNIQTCASSGSFHHEFICDDERMTYQRAVEFCDLKSAKLIVPTEESWKESLERIRAAPAESKYKNEAYWIGVTFQKIDDTEIIVADTSEVQLNLKQRQMIPISDKEVLSRLRVGEKKCVIYHPPLGGGEHWHFDLQSCVKDGVTPEAIALCRCNSEIAKGVPAFGEDESINLPSTGSHQGLNKSSLPKGKAAPGVHEFGAKSDAENTVETADASSTPLAVIGGLLVACCVLAALYFVSKRRRWNLRQRIAQRMPYNRPRISINGDPYLRGREMSEVSTSTNRPIHVYEEIILRNPGMCTSAHRNAVLSSVSSGTIPYLPPPDPPTALSSNAVGVQQEERSSKSVEDGYMQPSFRRNDGIPGDVRSPPPVESNVFIFSPDTIAKSNLLNTSEHKELKYASVETVQTLLDDNCQNDEEYFVEDENETSGMDCHFGRLVVEIPEERSGPGKSERNSVLNAYVPISGGTHANTVEDPNAITTDSPIFSRTNEYENECDPNGTTKKPPVKPKRKQSVEVTTVQPQTTSIDPSVVYSRIPSISDEPLYAKVKPKEGRTDAELMKLDSGAYTAMQGDSRQPGKMGTKNFDKSPSNPKVAESEIATDNYSRKCHVKPKVGNVTISSPSILSTTNKALENNSLVCYEIPPEFEDNPPGQ